MRRTRRCGETPPTVDHAEHGSSTSAEHEDWTGRSYETSDVDAFYDAVWGGEDIHVGMCAHPQEAIADASHRTVQRAGDGVADLLGPDTTVLDLGSGYDGSARALAGRGAGLLGRHGGRDHGDAGRAPGAVTSGGAEAGDAVEPAPAVGHTRRRLLRWGLFQAPRTAVGSGS
ncbi:hypothetical protein ACFV2Q_29965 [Streptomyces sp. NPDC059650]|uniref:hypothetical protein n=1 Tax=Streptomyces sp. NPDC059650 TaxID=3346896 RepID=UPI0036ADE425